MTHVPDPLARTDVWGNPTPRDDALLGDDSYNAYPPPLDLPFPGIRSETLDVACFLLYLAFAGVYVLGLVPDLPRTHSHDAWVAVSAIPALAITAAWPLVRHIPLLGGLLHMLPGLALVSAPFALDFWLMHRR